jgi:PucR C-terminal helix-turn-helix domain
VSGGVALAPSISAVRVALADALRARQAEIEEIIFTAVRGIGDSPDETDVEYEVGLQATVSAIVAYGLAGIEQGGDWSVPVPSVAVEQVRRAARSGVELQTVLRRYAAGHRHLGRFVMAEVDHFPLQALHDILDFQAFLLETLMERVSAEYQCEVQRTSRTLEQRRSELVRGLLANELVDRNGLEYQFDNAWHLGMIATGVGAEAAVQGLLTAGIGRELLTIRCSEQTVWAWLGSTRVVTTAEVVRLASAKPPDGVEFAIGEPAQGVKGWRLTHRQAQAARRVAIRSPQRITRYADVGFQAELLRDEAMSSSLVHIWLSPLDEAKDGGTTLRKTLRAYLKAGCNTKTTAFELGITRHTVERHINEIEARLGRLPRTCLADLDVALRLKELGVGCRVPSSG